MTAARIGIGAFLAACAVVAPGIASAQIGQGDSPVEITSDLGEYLQREGRGIYSGNVIATQGEARITTDKLTVVCNKAAGAGEDAACEAMEQLIAEGNVLYTAPDVKIRGDRAEYDYPSDTITITGDVILTRGNEGVVRGTRVVYNVGEGRTRITAGNERVTSIITPAKRESSSESSQPASPGPN